MELNEMEWARVGHGVGWAHAVRFTMGIYTADGDGAGVRFDQTRLILQSK